MIDNAEKKTETIIELTEREKIIINYFQEKIDNHEEDISNAVSELEQQIDYAVSELEELKGKANDIDYDNRMYVDEKHIQNYILDVLTEPKK